MDITTGTSARPTREIMLCGDIVLSLERRGGFMLGTHSRVESAEAMRECLEALAEVWEAEGQPVHRHRRVC